MGEWKAEEQQVKMEMDGLACAASGDRALDTQKVFEFANKAYSLYFSCQQTSAVAELATYSALNLCRTKAAIKSPQTSIVQRQRSSFPDHCHCTAEVCNQKAEVDECAGEGAETLPTDFFNDLQCFGSQWCPCTLSRGSHGLLAT
jgi:hypothetical protein